MKPGVEVVKEAVRIVGGIALLGLAGVLTISLGHEIIPKICVWIGVLILLSPANPAPSRARLFLFARIGLLCNVFALLILMLCNWMLIAKGWYESPQMMGLFSKLRWLLDPLSSLLQRLVNSPNVGVRIFPEHDLLFFVVGDYGNLLLQIVTVTLGLSVMAKLVKRVKGRGGIHPRQAVEKTVPVSSPVDGAEVEQFDLYFQGGCHEGRSADQVGQALREAFGLAPEIVPQLFCGKPITIKKGVSRAVAERYERTFEASGAVLLTRKSLAPPGGNVP